MDVARDMWAGVIKKGLWALSLIAFAMDDRTQRVADEIASIEAISHNTVKALSTVTTPLNVIVEMYIHFEHWSNNKSYWKVANH